jgi:hypothetical protein
MKLAQRMIPKGLQERAQPFVKRFETFLRDFEWTWTKAVVASLLLWFIGITALAVIPSWWLYFADETLGWRNTPEKFWLFKLRDVIASGLFGTPFVIMIVAPYFIQKWRRRLRSESESRPTGGYR